MTKNERHPWLDALIADPEGQVRALVSGHPFGPAEPQDAVASLLFGLAADDPAVQALDRGCLAVLQALRTEVEVETSSRIGRAALLLQRLLGIVQRLRPAATVADLHLRYAFWFNVFERVIVDHHLDLRREYWHTLALTQSPETSGRRLRGLSDLQIHQRVDQFHRVAKTIKDSLPASMSPTHAYEIGWLMSAILGAVFEADDEKAEAYLPSLHHKLQECGLTSLMALTDRRFWQPPC